MAGRIALATLVVRDYDEALGFFVGALGFALLADAPLGGAGKRWVAVAPPGGGAGLLLARAEGAEQAAAVGRQAGGRVAFFLETDDFARDHAALRARGVRFREAPRREPYGTVAVFEDLYGNPWDLIEPAPAARPGLDAGAPARDVGATHSPEDPMAPLPRPGARP